MRIYVDSNILIEHLRGNSKAKVFFKKIDQEQKYELWIGAMQRAEIVFFMRPNEEALTTEFLSQFQCAGIDQEVVDISGRIYRNWHKSHGVDPNDALLAGTVQKTGGKICTLNLKHFPMKDIIVEKPW